MYGDCGSGWFDSWLVQSACQSILGQDAEPQDASDVCIGVWMQDRKHLDAEKK